jgi:hypothetical protein
MPTPLEQRFGKHRTIHLECANGHTYDQDCTPQQLNPYICGACGTKRIRLFEFVYDAFHFPKEEWEESR